MKKKNKTKTLANKINKLSFQIYSSKHLTIYFIVYSSLWFFIFRCHLLTNIDVDDGFYAMNFHLGVFVCKFATNSFCLSQYEAFNLCIGEHNFHCTLAVKRMKPFIWSQITFNKTNEIVLFASVCANDLRGNIWAIFIAHYQHIMHILSFL